MLRKIKAFAFVLFSLIISNSVFAGSEIGKIKVLKGQVEVQREGAVISASLNQPLFSSDVIITRANSAVGVLFNDDSRIAAGSDSRLSLDQFTFDKHSHEGQLDVSVERGTLAVITGKLTEKRSGALQIKTPVATHALSGTGFSVSVDPVTE